jgi:hypothetical protein
MATDAGYAPICTEWPLSFRNLTIREKTRESATILL